MFEMLAEIFATPSDKARLITILLSSIVAIFIFIFNQWYIDRRERKQHNREKIEELYLASIDYVNTAQELLFVHDERRKKLRGGDVFKAALKPLMIVEEFDAFEGKHRSLLLDMNNAIRKMEMLCGLYFPYHKGDFFNQYGLRALPFVESLARNGSFRPVCYSGEAYEASELHISEANKELSYLCSKLMVNQSRGELDRLAHQLRIVRILKEKRIERETQIKSKGNPL